MIVCDFSQTMMACVASEIGFSKNVTVTEDLLRHMVLNSLRSNVSKFKNEYGELVLALDGKNYWRKEVFPYYKAKRNKDRKESPLDWKLIFNTLDKIKDEFREFMPYRLVGTDRAEADDVIGTLTRTFRETERVLILSADKDFVQLHDPWSDDVRQWDPIRKKWVTEPDPERFFMTKIIKGDPGDGIPSVHTRSDWYVTSSKGDRQKAITAGLLERYMEELPKGIGEPDIVANFERNKQLVDLLNTPTDVSMQIIESYDSQPQKGRGKILEYFMSKRLRALTQSINDF
jgi:hypothetical protein